MKPRLLDLFCGAGGAALGYQRAGFYVVGVDHKPQPDYCGDELVRADALAWSDFAGFDAVHAAPLWYGFAQIPHATAENYRDDLTPTLALLEAAGLPFVLEIGTNGPFHDRAVTICGVSCGLEIVKHMHFVMNWPLLVPPCVHPHGGTVTGELVAYAAHSRSRARYGRAIPPRRTMREWMEASGLTWMNQKQAGLASPPAYTELIGQQLLAYLEVAACA